jgi:outer membrane murein-binding lipoprotein Lpp
MSDSLDAKKVKELEAQLKRLEMIVQRLATKVDYLERERQRIKTDVSHIASVLRRQ